MKGALVISSDPALYETFTASLVLAGGTSADDAAQLKGAGGVTITVFADYVLEAEIVRGPSPPPIISESARCWVECRSEDFFIEWIQRVNEQLKESVWVVDSNGVHWAASSLDSSQIVL